MADKTLLDVKDSLQKKRFIPKTTTIKAKVLAVSPKTTKTGKQYYGILLEVWANSWGTAPYKKGDKIELEVFLDKWGLKIHNPKEEVDDD